LAKPPGAETGSTRKKLPPKLERRRLVLRFRVLLPSTREAIGIAVVKVMKIAREAGCVASEVADVEIAVREALANAIIHGNEGRPDKRVLLRCYGDPDDGILLAIRDEGKGFDPSTVPDPRSAERLELPHGRGIFLMHELMDHAEHRKGGREVVLYKACGGRKTAKAQPKRGRR
jgi:serine/threonine-protein kinase RsbW